MLLSFNASVFLSSDIESSDGDSSSEVDDMPWQQMWLSSDSDLDYEALRKENNWLVSLSCFFSLTVESVCHVLQEWKHIANNYATTVASFVSQ